MHNQKSVVCLHQQIRKTMTQNEKSKTPKKGLRRYFIFQFGNGKLEYFGSFDTKKSENVRIWLAENGYKGRYMWATDPIWKKVDGTNLVD